MIKKISTDYFYNDVIKHSFNDNIFVLDDKYNIFPSDIPKTSNNDINIYLDNVIIDHPNTKILPIISNKKSNKNTINDFLYNMVSSFATTIPNIMNDDKNILVIDNRKEMEGSTATANPKYYDDDLSSRKSIRNVENQLLNIKRKRIKNELLSIINEDVIIPGYYSNAEVYFRHIIEENKDLAFNILNEIYIDNLENENILFALIHLVSNFEYDYIYPIGHTIALLTASIGSEVLIEFTLRAYEKWGNAKSLIQLRKMPINIPWLDEYRRELIEDIESELKKDELLNSENNKV